MLDDVEECIKEDKRDELMDEISQEIKKLINPSSFALSPQEHITVPLTEYFDNHTLNNTVNIDAFLYSTVEVEELVELKELPSHYCVDCLSKNTEPLSKLIVINLIMIDYISHSASKVQCKFIIETLQKYFPIETDTHILDVGSRLGPILYQVNYGKRKLNKKRHSKRLNQNLFKESK